jgi:adenylyl-sulfate kinase
MMEKTAPKSITVWLTGLSGSGKTTLANALGEKLKEKNINYFCIDGDVLRDDLCNDLGFTDADRKENMRRASCLAKMMNDQGQIAIVSLISPFKAERETARDLIGQSNFIEIFIDCSWEECAQRDRKGLYKKVEDGTLLHFTGKDSKYEAPENPAVHIKSSQIDVTTSLAMIISEIDRRFPLILA